MQKIDFGKLLGFDTVASGTNKVDLLDETILDKLGARVGAPEDVSPANGIDFADENLGAKLGAKVGNPED